MEPHLFHVGLDLVFCDLPGQAQTSAEHESFAHCGLQRKAKSCCHKLWDCACSGQTGCTCSALQHGRPPPW